MFISLKDERYGLLSYLKNYFLRIFIIIFTLIFLTFVSLVLYFWLSVLSLYSFLRKGKREVKKIEAKAEVVTESRSNLIENMKSQSISESTNSVQMIPINMVQQGADGENIIKENGKFFILHV